MPNERGRIREHKLILSCCVFSCVCIPNNCTVHWVDLTYISLLIIFCIIAYVLNKTLNRCPSMWETRSESAHGHGLKRKTHCIFCYSAGGYQTALHYSERHLLDWGWIACIHRKASCAEPRGPYRDGHRASARQTLVVKMYINFV